MNKSAINQGAAVDIRSVTKSYGAFTALNDVSLQIEPGEFMTFLGPSGSGKTTTLNVVAGFTDVDRGMISVGGKNLVGVPAHKRNIGVVFQHYALFPHMSVSSNVGYPLMLRNVAKEERERRVRAALDMVKMAEFSHRYSSELSGGQQQRVALARAIVFDPPLLLMDEPLGALDKKLREWLQLEIKRIHRELGTTFIYVTHDQEEALVLSDRIAVFNGGKIEQVGTGRELYDKPATLFVGRFIGDSTILRGSVQVDGTSTALRIGEETVALSRKIETTATPVILLRPESLAITRSGEGSTNGLCSVSGTLSEAVYLGSGVKYEVRLADGSAAIVRSPITSETLAIGDRVALSFREVPTPSYFLTTKALTPL